MPGSLPIAPWSHQEKKVHSTHNATRRKIPAGHARACLSYQAQRILKSMKNLYALTLGSLAVLGAVACSSSSNNTPVAGNDSGSSATDSAVAADSGTGTAEKPYTHAAICYTYPAAISNSPEKSHRFAVAASPAADGKSISFQLKALRTPYEKPEENATTLSADGTVGDLIEVKDAPMTAGAFVYTGALGEFVRLPADANPVSAGEIELEALKLKGQIVPNAPSFCGSFTAKFNKPASSAAALGGKISAKCIFYPLAIGATLPAPVQADFDKCPAADAS